MYVQYSVAEVADVSIRPWPGSLRISPYCECLGDFDWFFAGTVVRSASRIDIPVCSRVTAKLDCEGLHALLRGGHIFAQSRELSMYPAVIAYGRKKYIVRSHIDSTSAGYRFLCASTCRYPLPPNTPRTKEIPTSYARARSTPPVPSLHALQRGHIGVCVAVHCSLVPSKVRMLL
ncbi:hypothetical protein PYCCODRAFT_369370 [Trametes coccinea BRFM310]|uniref:Uncharacterized protein n=1 Tax=Trametes coccinea (strain BRFM310) TaxID=1353009 RepID=A0A1Y2J3M1_TRAC3|nr:hypothetical protein PYCCODRAFT_369370 [Trametes coccinea BRFM310]